MERGEGVLGGLSQIRSGRCGLHRIQRRQWHERESGLKTIGEAVCPARAVVEVQGPGRRKTAAASKPHGVSYIVEAYSLLCSSPL
eukprot:6176511-Pleurochrysis_carterae.AAC.3